MKENRLEKISPDAGRAFRGLPCFRLTYIQEVILMRRKAIRRGALFYADLNPVVGSEQGGTRPILILQNDVGNYFSPTVVAAAITSRQDKNRLPTHIGVRANRCGLAKDSIVLTEQIRTLDKRRLRERAGRIPEDDMRRVDEALGVSMGLHDQPVAQSTHMDGGYF